MRIKSHLLLRIAGSWLALVNVGHTWGYYGAFVTRHLLDDSRRAAYELMKEPIDGGIMNPSLRIGLVERSVRNWCRPKRHGLTFEKFGEMTRYVC